MGEVSPSEVGTSEIGPGKIEPVEIEPTQTGSLVQAFNIVGKDYPPKYWIGAASAISAA
jgi:hypothetical protein